MQLREAISSVLATTKQETDTYNPWSWVEASVWTNPMLTALENGVKGGKWFSLMDKVYALATLQAAWQQVRKNKGSHGVDEMSIERFAFNIHAQRTWNCINPLEGGQAVLHRRQA